MIIDLSREVLILTIDKQVKKVYKIDLLNEEVECSDLNIYKLSDIIFVHDIENI